MAKGNAFLSEEEHSIRHLNVIITNPTDDMNYLVVPVTTYHEDSNGRPIRGQDESCILNAGCHPFIKHKSYVQYKNAKKMNALEIVRGIQKGLLIKKEDMPPAIIQDMQKGAELSEWLPIELMPFFKYFL